MSSPDHDDRTVVPLAPDESISPDHDGADQLLARLGQVIPSPPTWLLVLLALLAVAQLVIVAPWLVGEDPFGLLDGDDMGHLTRDGALGTVVAAAALLTAWRPRWALPSFAIASIALVAQTVAGVVDSSLSDNGAAELVHLPSVVLTCLTGLAAIRLTPLGR